VFTICRLLFCLLFAVYCLPFTSMWDRRRQIVWLAAGLIVGTFVAFSDAHDEDGIFVPRFFVFMESLVLIIIGTLFYIYSRRKQ
jgi:flagellar biosynthesis protein FliQ